MDVKSVQQCTCNQGGDFCKRARPSTLWERLLLLPFFLGIARWCKQSMDRCRFRWILLWARVEEPRLKIGLSRQSLASLPSGFYQ